MSVRQLGYLDFPNMWQFLSWSQRPTHWACPFITHMHMCICTRAHAHTHTQCRARWYAVSLIKGTWAALIGTAVQRGLWARFWVKVSWAGLKCPRVWDLALNERVYPEANLSDPSSQNQKERRAGEGWETWIFGLGRGESCQHPSVCECFGAGGSSSGFVSPIPPRLWTVWNLSLAPLSHQ